MATLGIDIGGTNLSLGLVENGKIIQEIHTPSFRPEMTLDETLDYLAAQIEKVFRAGTEKIGIGVPSVVDVKQGIVYDTQNIPSWTVVPLKERLEKRFGVPVGVNNDANCFAMGVYGTYPADAKPESLVVVNLGTLMHSSTVPTRISSFSNSGNWMFSLMGLAGCAAAAAFSFSSLRLSSFWI